MPIFIIKLDVACIGLFRIFKEEGVTTRYDAWFCATQSRGDSPFSLTLLFFSIQKISKKWIGLRVHTDWTRQRQNDSVAIVYKL